MMAEEGGLTASIRQRLLNIGRERGEDFQFVLTRFALERLLYRLSLSPHADEFVLKGALLFLVWMGQQYRPTKDLDLLGFGEVSDSRLLEVFKSLCSMTVDVDGLVFDENIEIEGIRADQEYQGKRVKLVAYLGAARIPLQIDVGYGDVVIPEVGLAEFPVMLDLPRPEIRIYSKESVVAEKLQAMISLGIQNSRMKDFYDIHTMQTQFDFEGVSLVRAIQKTFERRNTDLPAGAPLALTEEFVTEKNNQWKAFLRRGGLPDDREMQALIKDLREFLIQPMQAAANKEEFKKSWRFPGPWA